MGLAVNLLRRGAACPSEAERPVRRAKRLRDLELRQELEYSLPAGTIERLHVKVRNMPVRQIEQYALMNVSGLLCLFAMRAARLLASAHLERIGSVVTFLG